MFTEYEKVFINKWFALLVTLALMAIVILPGPLNFSQTFFLAHDYPFDYKNLMHLYVSESTGRISSFAFISLLPNIVLSKLSSFFGVYAQTFLIKILPYFIFTYFYLRKLIKDNYVKLNNWQDCVYVFGIYFLITLGLNNQMAINTGFFFNILYQFNFYLFLFHATLYIYDSEVIHKNSFKLLTFLLFESSILLGSIFIPITIYLAIIYCKAFLEIFNKRYTTEIALVFFSVVTMYFLLKIHGISLLTNFDETNNFELNRSYQAIKGGYFYQFIGFSNWGIYTGWSDRIFGGFTHFFSNPIFQASLFSLNALSLYYFLKQKKYFLVLILIIFLVLSVGDQAPFGFLYVFLLENVPGFASIRTPDNKFGVFIQGILLLNLLLAITRFKVREKAYIVLLLIGALIFLIPPLLTGKTVFGLKSIYSSKSTYILESQGELKMAAQLSSNDFVLLIPGAGNFDHPSGRVGPIDPMPHYIDHYVSYAAVIEDIHSPYSHYLNRKAQVIPPEINAVIYRKSFSKFDKYDWASHGFYKVYEDEYSILYKKASEPKVPVYSKYFLAYIIAATSFLYLSLLYLLIKYVRSTSTI